jgi:hypothetical protein
MERLSRLTDGLRRRTALGLSPLTAPVIIFIPLGFLLGPWAIAAVPLRALAHLDAIVTIGLATLGVFIGVAAGREGRAVRHLFAASTLEAAVTIGVVSGALFVLLTQWRLPLDVSPLVAALALGVCASASAATMTTHGDAHDRQIAARVADLDDVLPIVLGGVVIGLAQFGPGRAIVSIAVAVALGLGIGACGWLLFEKAESAAERGVFVIGALALLGGSAAYAGASPLLTGMTAGWFWVVAPGDADRLMADDLRKVQHPLVVLLLITAGVALEPSRAGLWLFAPYVVFRLAGKVMGGWAASRVAPGVAPSDLGAYLIPPGVIGVAFALNVAQVTPSLAGSLVFAVSAGAIACELIALVLTPPPEPLVRFRSGHAETSG